MKIFVEMESVNDKPRSLHDEKQEMSDRMQVFTVLLDNGNQNNFASHGIAPSVYMRQMTMSTEERTAGLIKEDGNELNASHSSVCFRATPKIVIFQQFAPGNTYRVTLSVKNVTSFSQPLKMICNKNSWFKLECKDTTYIRKLAPGMSIVCDVIFSPEESRDYKHQAVFVTGTETFAVPILAIGPRPLLDFPDFVEVPRTAVKILSVKHLQVRNIGDVPAVFFLSTSSPFSVYPQKGVLGEGETMQVAVNFLSEKKGCFKEDLIVTYETGEIISLYLYGSAEDCVIRLERSSIRMGETYLGLTRSKSFVIHNRSDYVSNFQWVQYENSRRDQLKKETYKKSFRTIKNIEAVRGIDLEHYNICNPLLHELTCQRVFADEVSCLTDQPFPFRHPNYRLIPLEGEIWPRSAVQVTVIFEPDEIGIITCKAYLEVTGCEERIPLSLHGICTGPLIKLNVACADLGCIFLCSNHNYEVICGNEGDVPGTLVYDPRPAVFGGKISVNPVQVKLQPGNYKSFNLCFTSNRTGDFTERVDFVVKESLEVISLLIKGSVICPTLHFDKPNLDFGVTALGFTTKHDICLHNSSPVPVTFCLTVTQDGTQPAWTHEEFARCVTKPSLVSNPKEFGIIPSEGVVAPHSFQRIKISYTPNVVRSSQTTLRAEMWDSDSEPVTLPIMFCSRVASLVVRPSEIVIRFCFINFPYMRTITVENKSDVDGYFYLPPQSVTAISNIIYSLSSYQGYLKPNESKSISLKIVTTALGRQKFQLSLLAFGDRNFAPCCSLICNGQGPIVTVHPTQLNWGEVRLLEEVKSTITLLSDSPIPARFVAALHKTVSPWTVNPSAGSLESNKSLELEITIYLRDTGKYTDKVDIEIMNGEVITCSLTAVGIGSSIRFDPNMMPVFDMGFLFRDQDVCVPITIANKGTRHHRLTWTTTVDFPAFQISGTTVRPQNKFTIDPYTTDLPPGAESVVHCKIRWAVNESLTEQWYLHGQIKGQGKREVLGTSLLKATFTDPNMMFSKRKLTFRYDPRIYESKTHVTDSLFVSNRSRLDLWTRVNINPPFELVAENEVDGCEKFRAVLLRDGTSTLISIRFNAQAINMSNLYARTFRGALTFDYGAHCAKDEIECIAEVNIPNISVSPMGPVILGCELGSTAYKNLTLVNAGRLPVPYSFVWLHFEADRIPTTTSNVPYQQGEQSRVGDSAIISEKEPSEREEEEEEEDGEVDERDTIGYYLSKRELPDILSTIELKPLVLSVPPTSNDLLTSCGNYLYARTRRRRVTASAEEIDDPAVELPTRCSSMLIAQDGGETNDPFSLLQVAANDIRDFIFPMIKRYFFEDTEIPLLKDWRAPVKDVSQYCMDSITEILDVVPREGIVLPYSSQYVYFELDPTQHSEIDAKVACRVKSGPTETMHVLAASDSIRYFVDKKYIDFGHELLGELCRATLTIVNPGTVGFTFATNVIPDEMQDRTKTTEQIVHVDNLRVEPRCGVVNPQSKKCLDITYYLGVPGPIHKRLDLEIAHHVPVTIHVEGHGSVPQVYLTLPRIEAFKQLPVEMCYQAVGTLTPKFLTKVRKFARKSERDIPTVGIDAPGYRQILKHENKRLTADGWTMITHGEILPTVTDIEMAVERSLTIEHMRKNSHLLTKPNSATNERGLFSLCVPEYIVDMGYVVIERVGYYSAILINYGPTPAEVRIRKARSKCSPLNKSGITVKFHDKRRLLVGESTPLNIMFHPTRSVYNEKWTGIEHTIYLMVTHGATIPISVRAVATYPFLTAHTAHLSFEEVAVGNCMLMPILLRNDGFVPCEWKAEIRCEDSYRSKGEIGPFFLHYSADTFLPGYENIVNIYYKPREAKYSAGQLRIKVEQSIFPVLVSMSGTGIEPELHVFEETLTFETGLPYVQPEPKTFFVKNIGSYPVEVFWRNFDTIFMEEERAIRILMHYYGVDEILFPPRSPGDKISPRVHDFYRTLTEEMMITLETRKSKRRGSEPAIELRDSRGNEDGGKEQAKENGKDSHGSEDKEVGRFGNDSGSTRHRLSEKAEMSLSENLNKSFAENIENNSCSYDDSIGEFQGVLVDDPIQIEALLHRYIDELHEREDFSETMKDPMKGVFDDAEIELSPIDHSLPQPRCCIIFHGAPFTEYQQAACQVGKKIGVSVLNINNAVTEIIALGKSAVSNKLREIVDKNYYALLPRIERYRKELSLDKIRSNFGNVDPPITSGRNVKDSGASSSRNRRAGGENDASDIYAISPGPLALCNERVTEDGDNSVGVLPKLSTALDALEELNKLPGLDELESMDPLDEYEYKIQSILLLQKIIPPTETGEGNIPHKLDGDAANDKTASGKTSSNANKKLDAESTFLGIGSDLLYEALEQRLAMEDFHAGFTVQTMDNIFIGNERDTLVMLLSIVRDVKYLLFVTFHNTLKMYLALNEKLVAAVGTKATEELEKKLITIEQMTWMEYNHISEDDKILYASSTLDAKRADSLRRRLIYNQRLAEAILNKKTPPSTKRAAFAVLMNAPNTTMKASTDIPDGSERTKVTRPTTTIGRKTNEGINDRNAANKKHQFPKELDKISRLMDKYQMSLAALEPVLTNWDLRQSATAEIPGNYKTPKSDEIGDVTQPTDDSKGINVWYVAPVDPWDSRIYDWLASYIADNTDIKTVPLLEGQSKISLNSKLYSVAGQQPVSPSPPVTESDIRIPYIGVYTLTCILALPEAGFDSSVDPETVRRSTDDGATKFGPEDSTLIVPVVEEALKPRWVMQPNQVCKFRVHFSPNCIGIHKDEYTLSIVGSNITRCIGINGSADIPRLSMTPEVMFSKVEQSKFNDLNNAAYFLDIKAYDFGTIPLMKIEEKRVDRTSRAVFIFHNPSTISANVAIFRMNNSYNYSIAPDLLNIAAGESGTLNVSAGVSKAGPNLECLLLCIRDNPQVKIIQLQSHGSKLEVELEGKVVLFEKMLLRRKAKRTIVVKNKSSVPLHWRLDLTKDNTDSEVTLHPERGLVGPLATSDIECNFFAKLVGIVEKKIITFQAYLEEHDAQPVIVDYITITGETYDVKVDLTNASPIDLKTVKVGTLVTETFAIRNRGPYDIGFIIQPKTPADLCQLKLNLPPTLNKDFQLKPASGSLASEKPIIISVNFLPRGEFAIFEAPLFKCLLIDTQKTPTAVAEFPILVSVSAHYAKVKIHPNLGLNFGPMAVFDEKTMHLDIENVGCFPFQYNINVPAIPDVPLGEPPIQDKKNKMGISEKTDETESSASRKGDKARSGMDSNTPRAANVTRSGGERKISTLRVGPFIISRNAGEVAAGEVETIAVHCCPDSVAIFEEEILVFVPNTRTNRKNGEPVKLSASGCIPTIDLDDLDATFRGNLIVDSVTDLTCPRELGPHSIYGRQEKCLYFRRVALLSTYTTQFRIHNPGFVCSDVAVKFDHETNDSVKDDGRSGAFVVEPLKAWISPMSTEIFTVSFSPSLLGSHEATFDIVLELPPPLKTSWVSIKLYGEGALPEVVLLEPTMPNNKFDQALMKFGRTLVGGVGYRLLSFENVGFVKAKVIVEISEDTNGLFTFDATRADITGLGATCQRDYVVDKRRIVCSLLPEEIACVTIQFSPNEVSKYSGRVDIFTVNNPYEKIALVILGESYAEDVIFAGIGSAENIYTTSLIGKRSWRSWKASRNSQLKSPLAISTESITSITAYKLDFGSCSLNELKRICFKIINRSKEHLFRFEWGSHPNVAFSPSIGYLNAFGCKDIIATFSALVPIAHNETQLECTINKITQIPAEMNESFSDDTQRNVRSEAGESAYHPALDEAIGSRGQILTKLGEPIPELAGHYLVPGSTKTIQVMICGTAGYSRYDCPIRKINFKDVFMFQSCKYTFILSNPGIVDMSYEWNLHTDAQHPMRLSNSALSKILRSLDATCRPCCQPKSRTLSRALYPTDHENPKLSIIASSTADNANGPKVRRRTASTASDLLSTMAVLNRNSTDISFADTDYFPFEITPEAGVLRPAESTECTLVFSPLDAFDYHAYLTCRMENLDPELPPLNVTVAARSLLPYCHFDIPESDYLSGGKRDTALLGPLASEIDRPLAGRVRVVEFQVLGVGRMQVKKFFMINPTAEDYHFSWHESNDKTHSTEEISHFNCIVTEGLAERGKQTEIIFTFLAKDVGIFESLWIFSIERYEFETTFLFVATVTEPFVYLMPGHLEIKPTFMGVTAHGSITIFNSESIPLSFRIMPKSLYSDNCIQRLVIGPMSGTLQPSSEEHLKIEFQPASPGESEFSIRFRVDKLKNPLIAIINTITHSSEPSVVYKKDGGEMQRIDRDKDNVIDCGIIQVRKPFTLNIDITNDGVSTFYYSWNLHPGDGRGNLNEGEEKDWRDEWLVPGVFTVTSQGKQGHVTNQSSVTCSLTITGHRNAAVLNHRVTLEIQRGPNYEISLKGIVQDPSYVLNFNRHDFGPCYIQSGKVCPYSTKIHFTNNEEIPCTLECKFDNLPHLCVDHEHRTGAVPGLSSLSILVRFIPREPVLYQEMIRLLINSTIEENIAILGEGIECKVCLVNAQHKFVDIGNIPVGRSFTKNIPLINKGRAPLVLRIGLLSELSTYKETHSKLQACKRSPPFAGFLERAKIPSMQEAQTSKAVLTIEPSKPIILHPNREVDISVSYSPIQRTATFEEKVGCQMHETILPLFILRGACIGAEFSLDKTFLSFGTVVEGCSRKMKIILSNTGDIGVRFNWDVEKLLHHYNLVPRTGYCSPGMNVTFIVTFSPTDQSNSIEGQATIHIENYGTMNLMTSGACESFPEPIDTVHLSTRVRQPTSVDITVPNSSCNGPWRLEAIVSGDYFTATKMITVSSQLKSNVCTVTYRPLLMTTNEQTHRGTLFFKLPEGRGLLYVLIGTSLPPEPISKIFREFPARMEYTELLPVSNWLLKTQRFWCIVELLDDLKVNQVYNFLGNKFIDIPSEEQRDYRAVFYSYKEGSFHFRVTFSTDEGEYHHYELQYRVTKPEIADIIKLETTVRTVACHLLKLENPLRSKKITYTIESPHPCVTISETSKLVNPESTEKVKVEFSPVVPFESTVNLDATCVDLGTYSYTLSLKATPATPEKPVRVSAILGSSKILPVTLKNYGKQTANFSIAIDDPVFSCEKNITIPGLQEATISVTYEPCELRNVSAALRVASKVAGDYVYATYVAFPIIGTTFPPKPQGPFTVTLGQPALITFKNVFDSTKTFDFHVDTPENFHLEHSSEVIQSKKTVVITVGLVSRNSSADGWGTEAPIAGRLLVCSTEAALCRIKWIYYLRGIFE